MPVEWTAPAGGATDDGLVVIYHHGGGYSSGISKWARRGTARLATALGARVVAPDYRLAPRYPFPAAHEDVLAVFRHLIGVGGFDPARIAAAGDSAGGAISVTLAADARDLGMPMPACLITNSLWADIGLNTPSLDDPVRNGYDIRREMVELLSATLLSTGGIDALRSPPLPRLPRPQRAAAAPDPGRRPRRLPRRQRAPRRVGARRRRRRDDHRVPRRRAHLDPQRAVAHRVRRALPGRRHPVGRLAASSRPSR